MTRFAVAAFLLLAGFATTGATDQRSPDSRGAKVERSLDGLTPGAPLRCLRRGEANQIRSFGNSILYVAGRNRIWRNDVVGTCAGLARGDIVVTKSLGSDACSGDLVQTRAATGGMLTGSCSLGNFVPYTKEGK
ncbi:hypothetical protein [Sphingomonas sp. M1-B02]|uniref:hypothetical protein n=1 Tax=Sphingomonas sp. M1-B02 TaxID=3114300 RepID=UPI00224065FE|nr:hypothetical protein [Sphingomonas sp. S6-11]UZK65845.1 hypothetical protein OKW87_15235 [Sphingomonas sp. S6-11]